MRAVSDAGLTGLTGRCYCGAVRVEAAGLPLTVAYCHCTDCRRWTGAPVGAFAAFAEGALRLSPVPEARSAVPGVRRWNCPACGSPLAARFEYLPGQVYVPLGILDDAASVAPVLHAHAGSQLPWLRIDDTLPRHLTSARDALTEGDSDAP